jgi:hypothetical protein
MYNLETLTKQDEDKRKQRQSQMYNLETLTTQDEDKRKQRGNHKWTI